MTDEADRRIVESSIRLAHSFNMKVVAEGVETSEILILRISSMVNCCEEASGANIATLFVAWDRS
jgi:EAL domain-containing protein (putative c-di-GMP-specific phosphodiesterase class I)